MTDLANVPIQSPKKIHNNQSLWVQSRSMTDFERDLSVSLLLLAQWNNTLLLNPSYLHSCSNRLQHPRRRRSGYNIHNSPSRKSMYRVDIDNDHYSIRAV